MTNAEGTAATDADEEGELETAVIASDREEDDEGSDESPPRDFDLVGMWRPSPRLSEYEAAEVEVEVEATVEVEEDDPAGLRC